MFPLPIPDFLRIRVRRSEQQPPTPGSGRDVQEIVRARMQPAKRPV